jgi:hypothetical protein
MRLAVWTAAFAAAATIASSPALAQTGPASRLTLERSSAGATGMHLYGSGAAGGVAAGRGRGAYPTSTARQIDRLLADKVARVNISRKLSEAQQTQSREAVLAAIRLILEMQSRGVLPAGAAKAFAAHGTISVSHDVSGWNRHSDNFNMNIGDLQMHLRNDSGFRGVSAVEIAADIIHDGRHVLQHQEGRSPIHHGFSFDPGPCGETNERAARFNRIVIANEREANEDVIEFYRVVPGLPQHVRTHLVRSIASPSDEDLLDRYRGRRRTDGVDTSWGRGCKH